MSEHEDVVPDFVRPTTINVHSNVSTYYRIDYLGIVKTTLLGVGGQPLLDRFLGGCFGHFLDFKPGPKCGMALHHVVSRQIQSNDNGMWFFINRRRIYFSPKDYALITGLHFGSSNFDVTGDHDVRNVKVFRTFCGGHQIRIAELVDAFNTFHIDDLDGSLHLRVAHVIVLYGMLFGYGSDKYVAGWIWALVDDLDAFSRFPWGAYSYQTLSHYTYNCKPKKKYHFYGPVWALHIWSFEILPNLADAVGRLVDAVVHPRCLRWRFRSLPALKDLRHLFENEVQHQCEIIPDDFEVGTSYWALVSYPSPIGGHYERPVNPLREGRQFPHRPQQMPDPVEQDVRIGVDRHRMIRATSNDESEHTAGQEPRRKSASRGRDKGKRSRPPQSSSSSSDDHMLPRRDRLYFDEHGISNEGL